MLRQWAQGDQATSGVRAEQDPIIGAQQALLGNDHPMRQHFRIPRSSGQDDIVLDMPRLVTTVGSAYLFMPGLAGLAWLSQPAAQPAAETGEGLKGLTTRALRTETTTFKAATDARPATLPVFDPTDIDFLDDPFAVYAAYREQAPVRSITFGILPTVWVFNDAHVATVAGNATRYHKQQVDQHVTAGLLNMDNPPHDKCRDALQPLFQQALAGMQLAVTQEVTARFNACQQLPQPVDWVGHFAEPVARALFFKLFGIDDRQAGGLMTAVDEALAMVSPVQESSLGAALQAVYAELKPFESNLPSGSLFKLILDMGSLFDPPFDPGNKLSFAERRANATVMVLAGVLPAKWALALATWHLLDNGGALLRVLRADSGITDRAAAEELLRFDSPTPMSLRYATE
ncbi:hypothetical protein ACVBEH_21705, partial [Roseateles sp. GG27B]